MKKIHLIICGVSAIFWTSLAIWAYQQQQVQHLPLLLALLVISCMFAFAVNLYNNNKTP